MTDINHKIGDGSPVNAYLLQDEVEAGKKIIYLGGDMEECERTFKHYPDKITDERIPRLFNSYSHYLESQIESVVSHEVIHLTIWSLTKSIQSCRMFDNIDALDEITGFNPPILVGAEVS